MARLANILDPIHPRLPPKVWRSPGSKTPRLRKEVKGFIEDLVYTTLEENGYPDPRTWCSLVLTGSTTTFQYSKDSDLDISLFVDTERLPDWSRAELIGIMISNCDGKTPPGVPYPLQCYVVPSQISRKDLYAPGLRSGYEIATDEWINPPERDRVKDIKKAQPEDYAIAIEMVDKMQLLIKHEPDKAKQLWHQIHWRRRRDQQEHKGDFSQSNIIYKALANWGIFPLLEEITGEHIASTRFPDEWTGPGDEVPSTLPDHVYRTMSEDHYQRSLKDGFHSSDERGNYIGQGVSEEPEGTVAGRWAYPGYLPQDKPGRIVKIRVEPEDGWEPHPDDEENGYLRTFKPIPVDRFVEAGDPMTRAEYNRRRALTEEHIAKTADEKIPKIEDFDIRDPALQSAIENGRFRFRHDRTTRGWGHDNHDFHVEPRNAPAEGEHEAYGRKRKYFYDPKLTTPEQGEFRPGFPLKDHPEWKNEHDFDETADPNLLYRGISKEEWDYIHQHGHVKTKGEYNIANEDGTLYSTSPDQARNYASGFAPQQFSPGFDHPGYVIAVPRTKAAYPHPNMAPDTTEVVVPGQTPASAIQKAWEFRPYAMTPGSVSLGTQDGETWGRGSSSAPSSYMAYRETQIPGRSSKTASQNTKLWVDDERRPPDMSWDWAKNVPEAKRYLTENEYTHAALDHDLGTYFTPHGVQGFDPEAEDGTDLSEWMVENKKIPKVIGIHSWNPDGAERMRTNLAPHAAVTVNRAVRNGGDWVGASKTSAIKTSMAVPLYHVAPTSARESIQKNGLTGHLIAEGETSSPWTQSLGQPAGNYFYDHPEAARFYAHGLHSQIARKNGRSDLAYPGDHSEHFWDHGVIPEHDGYVMDPNQDTDADDYDPEEGSVPYDHHNPEHRHLLPGPLRGYDIWKAPEHALDNVHRDPEDALQAGMPEPNLTLEEAREEVAESEAYPSGAMRYYTPDHVAPEKLELHDHVPAWSLTEDAEQDAFDSGDVREYPDAYHHTKIEDWKTYKPPPTHDEWEHSTFAKKAAIDHQAILDANRGKSLIGLPQKVNLPEWVGEEHLHRLGSSPVKDVDIHIANLQHAKLVYDPVSHRLIVGKDGAREGEQLSHEKLAEKYGFDAQRSMYGDVNSNGYANTYGRKHLQGPKSQPGNQYERQWRFEKAIKHAFPDATVLGASTIVNPKWEQDWTPPEVIGPRFETAKAEEGTTWQF